MLNSFKFSWIANGFIISIILVFLSEWIQKTGYVNFPLGFRHLTILLLFIINWFLYGRKLYLPVNYRRGIFLMFLYLIVAWFFSPAQLLNYLLGIAFTFLFVIMFILGINTKSSIKVILKIFKGLLIFFLLVAIIPMSEALIGKTGLRWIPTLFREMGAYATALNIGAIVGITMFIITKKKKYLYIAIFFSLGVLLTILKKTIISNLVVWIVFYIFNNSSKGKIKLIFYLILFIGIGYYIVGDKMIGNLNENINYLDAVGPKGHVRLGMYIASYNIVLDYFPFGSGMGTFASLASIIGGYSQLYFDYGVSNIGANSSSNVAAGAHTLLDTYWPHIFAELGILGSIVFLYLWFYPLKKLFSILRSNSDPFRKGLSFYIMLIIISMTWEGFTLYTPEIPSFVILHSGLVGLCYYHLVESKNVELNQK